MAVRRGGGGGGFPARPVVGDPGDARGMHRAIADFITWMRVTNYSERTAEGRAVYLAWFAGWLETRGINRPSEVTKPILERYQRSLYHHRKADGRPLSFRFQYTQLVALRAFFRWLARQNRILYNPASELELPRLERRLPRYVLSVAEAEVVLAQPDVTTLLGLRDRAILEVLYSTGMRRMELINIELVDLDAERGTVMIRQGKGRRDRMVPIGERAIAWTERYLADTRPHLVLEPDANRLFLGTEGQPFTPNRLTALVHRHVDTAALGKRGSCHLFRHTCATLMLEAGADIRYIQQLLGHAELSTTQIYTQVSIRQLQRVHAATHPASTIARRRRVDLLDGPSPEEARHQLMATLAEEAAADPDEPEETPDLPERTSPAERTQRAPLGRPGRPGTQALRPLTPRPAGRAAPDSAA